MSKQVYEPEIFDFEINNRPYTLEFCRDGLLEADRMGALTDSTLGLTERIAIILYAGLKKNNPFFTMKQARTLLSDALDEGYTYEDFNDIVDEFGRAVQATFTRSTGPKKTILSRRMESQKTRKGDPKTLASTPTA